MLLWCREGFYMQQDAEECWTSLMYTLREKLKVRLAAAARLVGQSKCGHLWAAHERGYMRVITHTQSMCALCCLGLAGF